MKYLLKAAATRNHFLKQIDVICKDPDGSVKARYDEFIQFSHYQFVNADVSRYLAQHQSSYDHFRGLNADSDLTLNKLETAHDTFMGRSTLLG